MRAPPPPLPQPLRSPPHRGSRQAQPRLARPPWRAGGKRAPFTSPSKRRGRRRVSPSRRRRTCRGARGSAGRPAGPERRRGLRGGGGGRVLPMPAEKLRSAEAEWLRIVVFGRGCFPAGGGVAGVLPGSHLFFPSPPPLRAPFSAGCRCPRAEPEPPARLSAPEPRLPPPGRGGGGDRGAPPGCLARQTPTTAAVAVEEG